MIIGKIWKAFKGQMNKMANFLWKADPMAQLQYEYDRLVDQLKDGRTGLEQYQALVARVQRQVDQNRSNVQMLEAKVKAYLTANDRESAGKFALDLQKAKRELAENEQQLAVHQQAYNNNLSKVKYATGKLADLRGKIQKYDADLKMSRAEAELAKVAQSIHVDVSTDFGEIEQVVQDEIDKNRAKAKVSADLSGEGLEQVQREMNMQKQLGEQALHDFEAQEAQDAQARTGNGKARRPTPASGA
jgi:phage shock protein A